MKYTERDLRAIDLFALVLCGTGFLFPLAGLLRGEPKLFLLGLVFLCLGTALNTALRRVLRNGGEEPDTFYEVGRLSTNDT